MLRVHSLVLEYEAERTRRSTLPRLLSSAEHMHLVPPPAVH